MEHSCNKCRLGLGSCNCQGPVQVVLLVMIAASFGVILAKSVGWL